MITAPQIACKLIGICGHAGVGKDTVGLHLHETRDNTYKLAFADPLKSAASAMFGIPDYKFYEADAKEVPDPFWGVTPRMIAQFFGTELVRENIGRLLPIGEDFWICRMIYRLTGQGQEAIYDSDDVVVISDVRFQNEYDWIIENGGIIIHLTRPGADGMVGISSHPSEAGIQFTVQDRTYEIANNGTREELYEAVDSVIARANIYPLSDPDSF